MNIAIASVAFLAGNANAANGKLLRLRWFHLERTLSLYDVMCSSRYDYDTYCFANPLSSSSSTFLAAGVSPACQEAVAAFQSCKNEAYDLHPDILDGALEKGDAMSACYEEAKDSTMKAGCFISYAHYFQKYCPTEVKQLDEACGAPSFEFEDFALDLACKEASDEWNNACVEPTQQEHPEIVPQVQELLISMYSCIQGHEAAGVDWSECTQKVNDLFRHYCPKLTGTMEKACGFSPLNLEDFALDLDLAEELEDGEYTLGS